MDDQPRFLQIEAWKGERRIAHGFGTRQEGGRKPSRTDWGGKAVQVEEDIYPLLSLRQVHGDRVVLIEGNRQKVEEVWRLEGDALLTRTPGIALGVFTADCLPIFFYDPIQGVIGIVHAGWRGTAQGVAGKAVEKMGETFGCKKSNILAALGPCIGPCCYEVDRPVKNAFISGGFPWNLVSVPRAEEKWLLDLYQANLYILENHGISRGNIQVLKICTSCHRDTFYSYRNADKTGGRQLNFIALRKKLAAVPAGYRQGGSP
jgi:YfiH family protein